MRRIALAVSLLAAYAAGAIPATERYVDETVASATNATLTASKTYANDRATQAVDTSKAYTDQAIISAGSVTPEAAAEISRTQTSNVVTKAYVEGLGIQTGVTKVNNKTGNVTLDAADVGAVPTTRKINGQPLSSDITINLGVTKVNEKTGVVTLDASDVGAVPTTRKINGQTLDQDITIASGVTSVNTKTGDVTLTASDVGATTTEYVDQQNQATRTIVESWEGFLDGSNVVFSITNYLSGSYNPNEAKLKILEMTNGVYREVYNSRNEIMLHIDEFRKNEFATATNSIVSGLESNISSKADRDWGKYTSAGGIAPSNTVYMTAPSTVFAGGLEYERVAVGEGMVGILTTKGAPTYTSGDEGTFKFQDDGGTNYFGFAKTDSYVIGCNTDGISVQNHIVTLTYNVTMSGVPCIWYCSSLDVQPLVWEQLNTPDGQPIAGASHTVTWEASPAAGTEVCYLNCPEAKGFFKATIEVSGSAKFMTNMPADLGGGIICSNTVTGANGIIRPTFNGSTVIWSWSAQ